MARCSASCAVRRSWAAFVRVAAELGSAEWLILSCLQKCKMPMELPTGPSEVRAADEEVITFLLKMIFQAGTEHVCSYACAYLRVAPQ